jgi:hypothetical protein
VQPEPANQLISSVLERRSLPAGEPDQLLNGSVTVAVVSQGDCRVID